MKMSKNMMSAPDKGLEGECQEEKDMWSPEMKPDAPTPMYTYTHTHTQPGLLEPEPVGSQCDEQ